MVAPLTEAQRELAAKHIRLVFYVAKRFHPYVSRCRWDDLYSEGYFALVRAASIYDPNRSTFSTLAFICIWRAIKKHLRIERYHGYSGLKNGDRDLPRHMIPKSLSRVTDFEFRLADIVPDRPEHIPAPEPQTAGGVRRVKNGYQARFWSVALRRQLNLGYFTESSHRTLEKAHRAAVCACVAFEKHHQTGVPLEDTFAFLKEQGLIPAKVKPPRFLQQSAGQVL